ncbi:MAG: hypothetical protein GX564_08045 [Oligosphaeraceae bacterium]|nr:hypothetical protein [Oligosphaeraceae bacterium]
MDNKERDAFIMQSLNQGLSLSEVQKQLAEQFNIRMTYLALRMLAADLAVDWNKQDKPVPAAQTAAGPAAALTDDEDENEEEEGSASPEDSPAAAGKTKVTVSKLVRPGTSLSGEVTFASGASGEWYVDNMGRLGLSLAEGSSKPTPEDVQSFQVALQKALGY